MARMDELAAGSDVAAGAPVAMGKDGKVHSMGAGNAGDETLIHELGRVVEAVAELDTFAEGDCDDRYCPFRCGWAEYEQEHHDDDCPITLARKIRDAAVERHRAAS